MDQHNEKTCAKVTIRLIRSFEHRNIRPIVLQVDLDVSTAEFQKTVLETVKDRMDLPPPVRVYSYDTMKIQHQAYGAKTNDPVINTDNDEKLILKPNETLSEGGVQHETEISFFNYADYKRYKEQKANS